MKLDLHGYTVHDAWKKFNTFISHANSSGCKKVTVITGHGTISFEIMKWCENIPYIRTVNKALPNTGAYTITFFKKR